MKKQVGNKLRGSAGFTLVELVVVIAIIGILAGVGTVGYSGYVKKANEAADQQLLGEVNTAFAAACVENGTEIYAVNDAKLNKDTAVLSDVTIDGAVNTKIPTSYEAYLGETNGFKVIEPKYSNYKHIFVDGRNNVQYAYGGGAVTISGQDAANLKDSTFMDPAKGLGAEELLKKVNDVTRFAAELDSQMLNQVFADREFRSYMMSALGIESTGNMYDDMMAMEGRAAAMAQQIMAKTGLSQSDAMKRLQANVAVMYAASNAAGMDQQEIKTLLASGDAKNTILGNLTTDTGVAMSQAALAYGMYTAYAYNSGNKGLINATNNPAGVVISMDTDTDFHDYINSEQGQKDLQGYLSALNMITSSAGDSDAVSHLLVNGFGDAALKDLVNQAVGQN